jgi:isopenicillin N synthase-like dioxygenase
MIPLIDLTLWRNGLDTEKASLAGEVDHAMQTMGFLMLAGHGISEGLREDIRAAASRFFGMPRETKHSYATSVGGRGWIALGREANSFYGEAAALPDLKESYTVGRNYRTGDLVIDREWFTENLWPAEVPELQTLCDRYTGEIREVYEQTLRICATALGLAEDWFVRRVRHSPHTFKINRYPPAGGDGPARARPIPNRTPHRLGRTDVP